jgi:nitronate monooxygenase
VHRANCFATAESLAPPAYKAMSVAASADDIVLTRAFTGLPTSPLRPSIGAAGLDPDALPERGAIDIAQDISVEAHERHPQRWKDLWSAGHSVSGVVDVPAVAELAARVRAGYRGAAAAG